MSKNTAKQIYTQTIEWLKVRGIDIKIKNINVEADIEGLAAKYKVTSIPFTVVEKEDLTETKIGLLQENELKKFILGE